MKKDLLYSLCCLAFAIVIGGAVYEHVNVVPQWAAAPPVSLSMFQSTYGLKPELFWMIIHPVNLALFVLTLLLHWRSSRRKNLLIVLTGYIIILVVTAIYFVPELINIISTPFSQTPDETLTQRAAMWEVLSLVRLGVLVILSLILFNGLTKAHTTKSVITKPKTKAVLQDWAFMHS